MNDSHAEPRKAHQQVDPGCDSINKFDLGIVNPDEAICLHRRVPEAPDDRDHHESLHVSQRKEQRHGQQHDGRYQEAVFESLEQQSIAVSSHQSGQMMAGRQKRKQM